MNPGDHPGYWKHLYKTVWAPERVAEQKRKDKEQCGVRHRQWIRSDAERAASKDPELQQLFETLTSQTKIQEIPLKHLFYAGLYMLKKEWVRYAQLHDLECPRRSYAVEQWLGYQ